MSRLRTRLARLRQKPLRVHWRRWRSSLRLRGWRRSLRLGLRLSWLYWRQGAAPPTFDLEHGVETATFGFGRDILAHSERGLPHEATQEAAFARMLAHLPRDFSRFTFVDVGAGRGRVLLLAAEFPFRAVVGVEHARDLFAAAQFNLEHDRRRRHRAAPVSIELADVADWNFPAGPLVVYIYNPCLGATMARIAAHLGAAHARDLSPLFLIYKNPQERAVWDAHPSFRPYAAGDGYIIYSAI